MVYRLYSHSKNADFRNTFRYFDSSIKYYTKDEIYKMYPEGNFEVIGEIGNFSRKYVGQDMIVTDKGTKIPIFPRGSLKKTFEWEASYVPIGENIYVSVVKSIIPRCIFRLFARRLL